MLFRSDLGEKVVDEVVRPREEVAERGSVVLVADRHVDRDATTTRRDIAIGVSIEGRALTTLDALRAIPRHSGADSHRGREDPRRGVAIHDRRTLLEDLDDALDGHVLGEAVPTTEIGIASAMATG